MGINMMELMSMNPNVAINTILSQNPNLKNNPLFNNAINMLNSGNSNGLENMARNLCKEKGIDINNLIKQFNMK